MRLQHRTEKPPDQSQLSRLRHEQQEDQWIQEKKKRIRQDRLSKRSMILCKKQPDHRTTRMIDEMSSIHSQRNDPGSANRRYASSKIHDQRHPQHNP